MESPLPISIQPLIDAYLRAIEPLRNHFYGIYVYGSAALDAFEEASSDIDLISRIQRMRETLAFIKYVRERGRKGLETSP